MTFFRFWLTFFLFVVAWYTYQLFGSQEGAAGLAQAMNEVRTVEGFLREFYSESPALSIFGLFLVSVLCTAVGIPVIAGLTPIGGMMMGFGVGFAVFWTATVVGGVLGFLLARKLARGIAQRRLKGKLSTTLEELDADRDAYLISMRLTTVVPYVLVNYIMGLTGMSLSKFAAITALTSIPIVAFYVSLGAQLSELTQDMSKLFTLFLLALCVFGILPLLVKKFLTKKPAQ